jgi:hypothetical protein
MPSEPNKLIPTHLESETPPADTAQHELLTNETIRSRKTLRQVLQNVGALGISTFVHTLIFIALGILTMTPEILESLEMVVLNAPEEDRKSVV